MRRALALSAVLAGCGVSTSQFDGLASCTTDEECAPTGVCHADGVCLTVETPCAAATDCGDLWLATCASGACAWVACDEASPCAEGYTCDASGLCGRAADLCMTDEECQGESLCDGVALCDDGLCTPGEPVDCSSLDVPAACLVGVCIPATAECEQETAQDGAACEDLLFCSVGETCLAGTCQGGEAAVPGTEGPFGDPTCEGGLDEDCDGLVDDDDPSCRSCEEPSECDDGNACTGDACEDGVCANSAVADGLGCDDDDACTSGDECALGLCGGTPVVCAPDGNPCTDEICASPAGCAPAANELACEDVYTCSTGDACAGGACVAGIAIICASDGNACTDDVCLEPQGCTNVANADGCSDGDPCTSSDVCAGGDCVPAEVVVCASDGDPCTSDACEAGVGCSHDVLADGAPCPDDTVCNGAETCVGGDCVPGVALVCTPDASPCTSDGCDDVLGCNPPAGDGASCGDGVFCNGEETCSGGVCSAEGAPCVDVASICAATTCDESTDTCETTTDDGLCDSGEICRPACFAGGDGCGIPPSSLALDCSSPVAGGAATSSCTLTLGGAQAGQVPCLQCEAFVGVDTLAYADFSEGSACSLDGWSSVGDPYNCPINEGPLSGRFAIESEGGGSDRTVALERSFDTNGYTDVVVCFDYAHRLAAGAGSNAEYLSLELDGDCSSTVLYEENGPIAGAGNEFRSFCIDLDALDACAAGADDLTLRFTLFSSSANQEIFLDDVGVYAYSDACVTDEVVFDDDVPCGGGVCSAAANGWTVDSGSPACSCSSGAGRYQASGADWSISRTADVSALDTDVYLRFDYGETGANESGGGTGPDSIVIDARATSASTWTRVFEQTGALSPDAGMRRFQVNLSDQLGSPVNNSASLGLDFRLRANGAGASVYVANIVVGGFELVCADGTVTVGSATDAGGGSYTFAASSTQAQRTQIACGWDSPSEPIDRRRAIEYRP
ncbi:MAG: hypothetical protein AABZ30_09730 [Myxococcota bacterium]